jgi:hypothetical protein
LAQSLESVTLRVAITAPNGMAVIYGSPTSNHGVRVQGPAEDVEVPTAWRSTSMKPRCHGLFDCDSPLQGEASGTCDGAAKPKVSDRAQAIIDGLVRTRRGSDARVEGAFVRLRAGIGGFYWVRIDGNRLLRGDERPV